MTINPQLNTVLAGELATKRVDRPATSEPRRAAAPDDAAKHAQADAQKPGAAPAAPAVPEFPLQELSIEKDPELGRFVVKVLDARTHEVVRQIPSEEWVRVLKSLRGAKGLFVDRKG
jgi:hypothetical protein